MNKFLCLLVALLLVGSFALSEAIDTSSMTDDDLLALNKQIDQAIVDRGLSKEFWITAGLYIGGIGITPGVYKLTATEKNSNFMIGLCTDVNSMNDDKGLLFMDSPYIREGDDPKVYSLTIAEGNVMIIKGDGEMKLEKIDAIG